MLHDGLDQQAERDPDGDALHLDGTTLTFAEVRDRVRRATTVVRGLARPGQRVALLGENDLPWVDALHAVPRAGAVLLFLNHRLAPPELASILARAGATALVAAPEDLARLRPALPAPGASPLASVIDFPTWEAQVAAAEPGAAHPGELDELAWLIYTSGTTGAPKGAMLTHRTLEAALLATTLARPPAGEEVYLYPFPLGHIAAYNIVHHLAQGRPTVLLRRFEAARVVEAVHRHGATNVGVAATMLAVLLDHLDGTGATLGGVRTVGYGAAPMPPALLRRAAAALPSVGFTQGYGMTELSGNAVFLGPEDHARGLAGDERLLRAAGWPAPGVELAVLGPEGRTQPHGVGELVVRAPQVMVGYWDDAVASAAALEGGLHTGDLARIDDDGLLTILDRVKDVIVTGGENVSSLEVEAVLRTHPSVRDVAVVGVPDPRWGENVCAVVVPAVGATVDPAALSAHVRAALAGFKAPRHVVVVDELPVNGSGKVRKADLRRELAATPERLGDRT